MLDKILNVFNKGKIMDDVKVDQEVIAEETPVVKEEVKKEKPKKEDPSSWFMS